MNKIKKQIHPPKWASKFLAWYCAPELFEEIEGDLEEEFSHQLKHHGPLKAKLDYIRSVIGFIPVAIKRKSTSSNPFLNMNLLLHFITVANRNIVRQKVFSAINILGLALGMTCCLFIYLWIVDEKKVDNFHVKGRNLYNVYETITTNNVVTGNYTTTVRYPDGKMYIPITDVRQDVPEVEAVSFYATGYEAPWGYAETFQVGDRKFKFEGSRASNDFLRIFSYPVIAGQRDNALKDLSSIALSRKMAEMFFDSPENAIGKSIRYENNIDFVITAVFEDVPIHSTLKFDFLINWESHMSRLAWASPNVLTTFLLKDNADISLVEEKINRYMQAHLDQKDPRKVKLALQQFGDRYLYGNFVNGKPEAGRNTYVNIFTGVAIFILIIACINFMNLATARSIKRAKEIGVRKVVGSPRKTLIFQFLGESIVLAFFAMILSLILVVLLLPAFNSFTQKEIVSPLAEPSNLLPLVVLMIITGILSGSYPALFLSSLRPVAILKGGLRFSGRAVLLRKSLTVFQFAIGIFLIVATLVITRQTDFVQHTHLGYDKENLLYLRVEGELMNYNDSQKNYNKYNALKNLALNVPGVAMVDKSSELPHAMGFVVDENDGHTETANGQDAINWEGKEAGGSVGFKPMSVGFDFLKVMNLEVVEGRGFSKDHATDSADAFIVNEEAVKQMGMKDPIGKWISAWNKKGHIIGVVKNYHTHSLHEPIKPLILDVKEYEYFGVVLIKTEPGKTKEALAGLEKVYQQVNPNYPFAYQFVDQEYAKLYRNEQIISTLSNCFAVLAIVISCLGLLGLVMFAAEQRTREFGIRKVLGATVTNIVALLSQDFLKMIVISFFVAAPIAGYLMYQWLQGFAYRIILSWDTFAVAGGVALLIAFLTICAQAFQSAVASPVKALKVE